MFYLFLGAAAVIIIFTAGIYIGHTFTALSWSAKVDKYKSQLDYLNNFIEDQLKKEKEKNNNAK